MEGLKEHDLCISLVLLKVSKCLVEEHLAEGIQSAHASFFCIHLKPHSFLNIGPYFLHLVLSKCFIEKLQSVQRV